MTKTKKRSRLFAVLLVAVLAFVMAAPSFAAPVRGHGEERNFQLCFALSEGASSNTNVNVYGNNTVASGRNVCMWSGPKTSAQTWNHLNLQIDGNYRMVTELSSRAANADKFCMNVYKLRDANGRWNCTMERAGTYPKDTAIIWTTNYFYLTYDNTWNLAAIGDYNNADVRWVQANDYGAYARFFSY